MLDESPNGLIKPERAVGNLEVSTPIGLYHGQMLGMSALHTSNLNLYYKSMFKLTGSTDNDSFYPQIAYFANHANERKE